MRRIRPIFFLILWAIVVRNVLLVLLPGYTSLITPDYDEDLYKRLENLYNHSQYRQKNPTTLIPDNTLFRYAAGAYLRGVDPILINSEHTPLGKYFIALSIFMFHNDGPIIVFFALITLFVLWLLSAYVIHDKVLSVIPVVLFSSEPLFLDQIRTAPNLDIIQLPFIFLALYLFMRGYKKNHFFLTTVAIGFVIATKTLVPGILLIFCFLLFLFTQRKFQSILIFITYLPIALGILMLSYLRTFMNGYSFRDFLGFQKWIFQYQQSKLIYPFSVWRLIFLNKWQTWWDDMRILQSAEWQITWPIFTGLSIISILFVFIKRIKASPSYILLVLWSVIYLSLLSLGVVSSRFLMPVLPILYIIGAYTVKQLLTRK